MMNKKLNIVFHWLLLPFRLLYILVYYLTCILLSVKNEDFHIYYDKSRKVIMTGWLKFYDPDAGWKQFILVTTELWMLIIIAIIHLYSPIVSTGIILLYSLAYVLIRYDFKTSIKYLKTWKYSKIIREYVGDELYYYAKWNYEDLTLVFPELAQLKHKGNKIVQATNVKNVPLEMCKQIWQEHMKSDELIKHK